MAISREPKVCSELPNSPPEGRTEFCDMMATKMLDHALADRMRTQRRQGASKEKRALRNMHSQRVTAMEHFAGNLFYDLLQKTPANTGRFLDQQMVA